MFAKKRVLTIGAYERDNFGDLLFFLVLKAYLKNFELIPGATVTADMTNLMGEIILPYTSLINQSEWDAVWVVGGEIGGASIEAGIVMSIDSAKENVLKSASVTDRQITESIMAYDTTRMTVGYLPSADAVKSSSKFIINSVGMQGLKYVSQEVQEDVLATLNRADYFSVRDTDSLQWAQGKGLSVRLSPDMVHMISSLYRSPEKPLGLPEKYLLVQISEDMLKKSDKKIIADQLNEVATKYGMSVVFFAAGTANYHDSFSEYEEMKKLLSVDNIVYYERDPLALAFCIAHSSLWIGSSLHGRIISCAYGINRISLDKDKVNKYAEHWDRVQPYGVTPESIIDAADSALNTPKVELVRTAKELCGLAKENIDRIVKEV